MVERTGNGIGSQGSITAFYTVFVEGDDQQDPIADAARAVLDGHVVLTRSLAEQGHFPAIDVEQSISRVMQNIVEPRHHEDARQLRGLVSRYQKNRDLINLGAYIEGSDAGVDRAIRLHPQIEAFLQQGMSERADFSDSKQALRQLVASPAA